MDARHRRYRKFDAIAKATKIKVLTECVRICSVVEGTNGKVSDVKKLLEMELMSEMK